MSNSKSLPPILKPYQLHLGSICWTDGGTLDSVKVDRISTLSHNLDVLRGSKTHPSYYKCGWMDSISNCVCLDLFRSSGNIFKVLNKIAYFCRCLYNFQSREKLERWMCSSNCWPLQVYEQFSVSDLKLPTFAWFWTVSVPPSNSDLKLQTSVCVCTVFRVAIKVSIQLPKSAGAFSQTGVLWTEFEPYQMISTSVFSFHKYNQNWIICH